MYGWKTITSDKKNSGYDKKITKKTVERGDRKWLKLTSALTSSSLLSSSWGASTSALLLSTTDASDWDGAGGGATWGEGAGGLGGGGVGTNGGGRQGKSSAGSLTVELLFAGSCWLGHFKEGSVETRSSKYIKKRFRIFRQVKKHSSYIYVFKSLRSMAHFYHRLHSNQFYERIHSNALPV